ncbi:unnamed protein product [Oreochromis niloticus]|nr:unnamed protein product [Mustela putorius furo]
MAMKGGENVRWAESDSLKRKLRDPLNLLLLRKTRSRSEGEEPPEEVENKTTARHSDAAVERGAELKEGSGMEGEAPPTGTCRGHCRNRRRCRWWRRFSSELICIRRIKKKVEKRPGEQQQDSEVEPQLQDKRAKKRAWPKFRKSRNSSYQQREEVQGEAQKRLHRFFIRGGNRRPQEDMVAVGVAQTDTVQATVIVETSVEVAQDQCATGSPGEPAAGEMYEEVKEGRPETFQKVGEVDDITVGRPLEVFTDSADAGPFLHKEFQSSFQSSSSSLQAPANGLFIRIELCPQEKEEEEECWEGSSSSQNHLLLHLLDFGHSERQLLQMAHTLVRAAVNAAVDQLTRELQSTANCVHRDHA